MKERIRWWLSAIWLVSLAVSGSGFAETQRQTCASPEPWGWSEYRIIGQTIEHYVKARDDDKWRLARHIPSSGEIALCTTIAEALVFVVTGEGVYQVDRGLDAELEAIRLAVLPDHFNDTSKFIVESSQLYLATDTLVTDTRRTEINIETRVLNDDVVGVTPVLEIEHEPAFSPPLVDHNGNILLKAGAKDYRFAFSFEKSLEQSLELHQGPSVRLTDGAITFRNGNSLTLDQAFHGICHSGDELIGFDATGLIRRFKVDTDNSSVQAFGSFRLENPASHCLIDHTLNRLYVTNHTSVLWVFDLSITGLEPPRGVTSDRIVESVDGVASYQSSYVLTQSSGDHSFLVFAAEDMKRVGQFRVVADVPAGIDGVTQSGGFAAVARPLPDYPQGVLVVHDESNRLPSGPANLKLIDWRDVQKLLE